MSLNGTQTPTETAGAPAEGASPNLATALGTEGAPPQAAPTETPKQESASQAFSLIAKEKKRVLEMRERAAAREKAIEEREARLKEQEGRFSQKPQTPLEALQAAGFSYEDATNYLINNNQLTPEQKLKQMEEKFEGRFKAQEDEKKRQAEDARKQAEAAHAEAVEGFKGRILETISSNPDKYEYSALEDPDDVKALGYELADLHFNQHKKVLSEEEVSDLIESYYEDRAQKIASAKKFQAKLKPADPAPEAGKAAPAASGPPKTLAAAITSAPAPVYNPARSADDRMKRAVEALERMGK